VAPGLIDNTYRITGPGVVAAPLLRTRGQLLDYAFNVNNANVAQIAPTALSEISWIYGGNRTPRQYKPPHQLLESNQDNYNGLIVVGGLNYTYLDFEVDNPARDLYIPEGLVELATRLEIPSSVEVKQGAYLHYVQESLYPVT
jgi:hypothetical protein